MKTNKPGKLRHSASHRKAVKDGINFICTYYKDGKEHHRDIRNRFGRLVTIYPTHTDYNAIL